MNALLTEHRLKYLRLVPPGGNWRDLPQELLPKAMGGAYKSDGGKTGFYRRLSYDEPSPTLVTSPIHKSTSLMSPQIRQAAERKRVPCNSTVS